MGGSATYFSHSASFFSPVKLVAVVGEDFPQKYIEDLNQKNIDTSGLIRQPGKNIQMARQLYERFERSGTIETNLNVFESFQPVLPENYKDTPFVFLANH